MTRSSNKVHLFVHFCIALVHIRKYIMPIHDISYSLTYGVDYWHFITVYADQEISDAVKWCKKMEYSRLELNPLQLVTQC